MNLAQHDKEAVFCLAQFWYLTQLDRKDRGNAGHALMVFGGLPSEGTQHHRIYSKELILQRYMFSVSRYCKRTYSESGYQG